jgi:hypothetical protein
MRSFFLVIFIAASWPDALAQSSLPPCATDSSVVWTNCVGSILRDDGGGYTGGWKDDKWYGQGLLISPKGNTLAEGVWRDDIVAISGVRYKYVDATEEQSFFVLIGSIRQEGTFRRAWQVNAYNEPQVNFGWMSGKLLKRFDCTNERTQLITASFFSESFGTGELMHSFGEAAWEYVYPNSAGESLMKYVCGYKLPKNK